MKKVYKLEDLGCANCAAKMEKEIGKLEGVNNASINFFTQKLILEADNEVSEDTAKAIEKIIKKIEPDCKLKI